MPERRVGAQGAEERLLEGVLGPLSPEPADEHAEHLVAVLGVEALERGMVTAASIIEGNAQALQNVRQA